MGFRALYVLPFFLGKCFRSFWLWLWGWVGTVVGSYFLSDTPALGGGCLLEGLWYSRLLLIACSLYFTNELGEGATIFSVLNLRQGFCPASSGLSKRREPQPITTVTWNLVSATGSWGGKKNADGFSFPGKDHSPWLGAGWRQCCVLGCAHLEWSFCHTLLAVGGMEQVMVEMPQTLPILDKF